MKRQNIYSPLSHCLSVKLNLLSGIIITGILATTISLCRADVGTENTPNAPDGLSSMSIEELMEIEVTSVSKKPQKLADVAAAVFIITQEDIRRSGATTIADALRMAPGVQVAKMSSNKWAVSIRGINGRFANKLLVLLDGRTLYNPLFSGVYWEVQDTVMEDISRIEVIRGPAASLWGANAVNGVSISLQNPLQRPRAGLSAPVAGQRNGTLPQADTAVSSARIHSTGSTPSIRTATAAPTWQAEMAATPGKCREVGSGWIPI